MDASLKTLVLFFLCVCVCVWDYCICTNDMLYMQCIMYSTITPVFARRSCTTSRAWKWRETPRGSWSRSCSQTQTTLLCWQAGATLQGVCSSRFPSARPPTWSRLSPARTRRRAARWPSTCPKSRPPHMSGQYWAALNRTHRSALILGTDPPTDRDCC